MSHTNDDYRLFVGAFPQGETAMRLQALRERLDPRTAQITPPHVTLAGTYRCSELPEPKNETDSLVERLQALRGRLRAFSLLLGGVHTFPPFDRPVIYLGVGLTPELQAARAVLLEALGPDRHARFVPHLTLAMRLNAGRAQAALAGLQASEWQAGVEVVPIAEVWLMQRGADDPTWRRAARVRVADEDGFVAS